MSDLTSLLQQVYRTDQAMQFERALNVRIQNMIHEAFVTLAGDLQARASIPADQDFPETVVDSTMLAVGLAMGDLFSPVEQGEVVEN